MSLIVFNGSPRGKNSNSSVITEWFLNNKNTEIEYLNKVKRHDGYIKKVIDFSEILFVFPLYVDGMPGIVKHFFEIMYSNKKSIKNKRVTYIIHSGFPETIQSRILERYLNRFSDIMGFNNHGVIIIPGSEGFRLMPPFITRKKSMMLKCLGEDFFNNKKYNEKVFIKIQGKEKNEGIQVCIFKLLSFFGLSNIYWDKNLKSNNAFDKRFDSPYK
jgi:multimeric flavodoxin WrbA